MKNYVLLFFLFCLLPITVNSQTLTFYQEDDPVCPNKEYTYSVKLNSPHSGTCKYSWSVSNGTLVNQGTSTSNFIKWDDRDATGVISVATFDCSTPDNNGTNNSLRIPIISIKGKRPTRPTGPDKVEYYDTSSKRYQTTEFKVSGLNIEVPEYEWQVPPNWSNPSDGRVIYTNPDNFSDGDVKVRGISGCPNASKSDWSLSRSITRTIPQLSSITLSKSTVNFGSTSYITATTSDETGATYYWTIPCGWTGPSGQTGTFSTSSHSIKVYPSGYTEGTISVIAKFNINGSIKESNRRTTGTIKLANLPSISGPSQLCYNQSKTYTLNHTVPSGVSVSWAASPSSYFQTSTGSGRSASLKMTNSRATAYGSITFSISKNGCSTTTQVKKWIWFGKPSLEEGYISGNSSANCGSIYIYDYNGPVLGETSTRWVVSLQFDDISTVSSYELYVDPTNGGEGYVTFVASNTCGEDILCKPVSVSGSNCGPGYINFPSPYSCGGGGVFPGGRIVESKTTEINTSQESSNVTVLYPNPTDKEIFIDLRDKPIDEKTLVEIMDINGKMIYSNQIKKAEFSIDVSSFTKGTYLIVISNDDYQFKDRILIN